MTDQQLLVSTLHEVGQVLAQYLKRTMPRNAGKTNRQLIATLDNEHPAHAIEWLEKGRGPNVAFTVWVRKTNYSSNVLRCIGVI